MSHTSLVGSLWARCDTGKYHLLTTDPGTGRLTSHGRYKGRRYPTYTAKSLDEQYSGGEIISLSEDGPKPYLCEVCRRWFGSTDLRTKEDLYRVAFRHQFGSVGVDDLVRAHLGGVKMDKKSNGPPKFIVHKVGDIIDDCGNLDLEEAKKWAVGLVEGGKADGVALYRLVGVAKKKPQPVIWEKH